MISAIKVAKEPLFLRDSEQKVLGGLDGFMGLGWIHISTLWIAEELRGHGYGRRLLLTAEQEAVRHGCFNAYVFHFTISNNFFSKFWSFIFSQHPP